MIVLEKVKATVGICRECRKSPGSRPRSSHGREYGDEDKKYRKFIKGKRCLFVKNYSFKIKKGMTVDHPVNFNYKSINN